MRCAPCGYAACWSPIGGLRVSAAVHVDQVQLEGVLERSRALVDLSAVVVVDAGRLLAQLRETKRARLRALRKVEDKIDVARAWCTVPGLAGEHRQLAPGVNLPVWILHVRYARSGDRRVMSQLVAEYHSYALGLARRMHRTGESIDDLQQVALEALVGSLERFDPNQSIPFAGFATPTITGALKRHFRDRGYAVRLPRRLQEVDASARQAHDQLVGALGVEPTEQQIAEHIGHSVAEVREAAQGVEARRVASLDQPTKNGGPVRDPGSMDASLTRAENLIALRQVVGCLDDRDREVLGLYFLDELSQQAIAARFGVSQMQVSRWISRSLKQLRSHLGTE
jgi:RNA polymerase sigma-B factor